MVLFCVIWFAIGIFIGWPLLLGSFTRVLPYMNHNGTVFVGILAGPIGVVSTLLTFCIEYEWGWRYKPLSHEERRAIYMKTHPDFASEEFFDANY